MGYVVAIKPSARRANATAGAWVSECGRFRSFNAKADAREWAREASDGDGSVYVRDANPDDRGEADGYLMGRGRARPPATLSNPPGEQVALDGV